MSAKPDHRKPSAKAKNLAARLLAVQALYQSVQNKQRLEKVMQEFLSMRVGMEVEGEKMVEPDGALFTKILEGVGERSDDIEHLVDTNIQKNNKDIGMLLKAILICGSSELLVNQEADAGVIINDYINVAHGFFDSGEAKLINAILDAVAKDVRS